MFFSSSSFGGFIFKKITGLPVYRELVSKRIFRQIVSDKQGLFNLIIENANLCNASCLMCPYRIMKRAKKIMDSEIFEKIIERVKQEKLAINKIFLSGMGEPLTDPQFVGRVEKLKKLGFPLRVYTNASLLTKKISEKLILLGPEEVNISFNGADAKEYHRIMGLNFDRTMKNIDYLIKIRKKSGRRLPWLQVSLIVLDENSRGLRKYLADWRKKVDSVTVSIPHQWGGGIKEISNLKGQRSNIVYPCRALWHTFMIDSSGNFVICCRDYESKFILGNVRTHSFEQIRKSKILKSFQDASLKYRQDCLPEICKQCNFPYQGGVDWFLPRSLD